MAVDGLARGRAEPLVPDGRIPGRDSPDSFLPLGVQSGRYAGVTASGIAIHDVHATAGHVCVL